MTDRRHDPRPRPRLARRRLQERPSRLRGWDPAGRALEELISVYSVADAMPESWTAGSRYVETLRLMKMSTVRQAKFQIGDMVRHRVFPFRGVIFDVDPVFANTEEWWESIPEEIRPSKDQPFYHLLAENEDTTDRKSTRLNSSH